MHRPFKQSFLDQTQSQPEAQELGQIPTPKRVELLPPISLFKLMSQFEPTRDLTTGISQENKHQTPGGQDF